MKQQEEWISLLRETIKCAEEELANNVGGSVTRWTEDQLTRTVLPELNELLIEAQTNQPRFKFAKGAKILDATDLMNECTDVDLWHTPLGKRLIAVQDAYRKL